MKYIFRNPNTDKLEEFNTSDEANIFMSNAIALFESNEKRKLNKLFSISQITLNENGDETWSPPMPIENVQDNGLYAVTNSLDGLPVKCNGRIEVEQKINEKIAVRIAPTHSTQIKAVTKKVYAPNFLAHGVLTLPKLNLLLEESGVLIVNGSDSYDLMLPESYNKNEIKPLFEKYNFETLKQTRLTNASSEQDFNLINYKIFTKPFAGAGGLPLTSGVFNRTFPNGAALYAEIQNNGLTEFDLVAQETFYDTLQPRNMLQLTGLINGKHQVHYLFPVIKVAESVNMDGAVSEKVAQNIVDELTNKFSLLVQQEKIKNTFFTMQFIEGLDGKFYPVDFNFTMAWRLHYFTVEFNPERVKNLLLWCFDLVDSIEPESFEYFRKYTSLKVPSNKAVNLTKALELAKIKGCVFSYPRGNASSTYLISCEANTLEEAKLKVQQCEEYLNENIDSVTYPINNTTN